MPWLEAELRRIPNRGGLANAIRYALARWPALCRFLDDGRIELDNNPVERAIRPLALGRRLRWRRRAMGMIGTGTFRLTLGKNRPICGHL